MHKIVNGKKIELSQEKALKVQEEWDKNILEKESKILEKVKAIKKNIEICRDSGIKDETICLIVPGSKEVIEAEKLLNV